jgi:glycosyltransferase involved in cell wall biosynthesis
VTLSQRVLIMASPEDAGPPWLLSSLCDHLQDEGHRVTVTGDVGAAHVDWSALDVIHAFGWTAARALADRGGPVPWVLTAPWAGGEPDADIARRADLIVCESSESAAAANRSAVPYGRCIVLPTGVDTDTFTRHGPRANRTPNHRIVVRALGPGDGVPDVIAALPAIPGAELVVLLGSAPVSAERTRYHHALQEAASSVGIRARVALVPARDALERAWWLRSADVVVSVAERTGDHGLVVEAMACGRAVVVTAIGPQRDLVVTDVTGLHVPARRVRALALSLRHLLGDSFRVEGMGYAGADRALSRCAWPRVAREFGLVYTRVSGQSAITDEVDVDVTDMAPTSR